MLFRCRSPYGERGLKSILGGVPVGIVWSLPSRGAWIEIAILGDMRHIGLSLPSRGAWLEIRAGRSVGCEVIVAHRGGSDD